MSVQDNPTCTTSTLAKLLGLSTRRVSQLAAEGIIPKSQNGHWEFIRCNHAYIQYIKNKSASASMSRTKDEILQIERDAKALKLAKEKGLYILKSDVAGELVKRIVVLKRDLKVLEHRLTKYPKAREIVKDHIYRMLSVYSGKTGVFQDRNKTKRLSSSSSAGSINSPGSGTVPGNLPVDQKARRKK